MQPIDKNFTPVEYDPQYILMVNQLKKYFPIKGGMVGKTVGQVKAVDGVTFNLKLGTTMRRFPSCLVSSLSHVHRPAERHPS